MIRMCNITPSIDFLLWPFEFHISLPDHEDKIQTKENSDRKAEGEICEV